VELLRAIKTAFAARAKEPKDKDRITSAGLSDDLVADATAPWATYNKGKPISQRQIAGLLKSYGIKPKTIRLDDGTDKGTTAKGYLLEWFTDVFDRYCTPSSPEGPNLSVTSVTDLFSQGFSPCASVTSSVDVTDKNDEIPLENNDVTAVTDKNRRAGEKTHTQLSYEVLGPAPAGTRCTLCGSGGGQRIRHGRRVNLWHPACADRYLAAMVDPPVKVPQPLPDSLDVHMHRAPHPTHPHALSSEPGLSPYTIRELASWYEEEGDRRRVGLDLDQAALDGALRQILAERGVFREFIEIEFERVMEAVFPVSGEARGDA
jgi:hypothetical protein